MKIIGSQKDLGDVRGVLEVSSEKLNLPLLKKLARQYGPEEAKMLESLLKKNGKLAPSARGLNR